MNLFLPYSQSLKDKRQILKSLKEKTTHRFKIPVVETDYQDLWQRAQLGFAVVGSDRSFVESLADQMVRFIKEHDLAQIHDVIKDVFEF